VNTRPGTVGLELLRRRVFGDPVVEALHPTSTCQSRARIARYLAEHASLMYTESSKRREWMYIVSGGSNPGPWRAGVQLLLQQKEKEEFGGP